MDQYLSIYYLFLESAILFLLTHILFEFLLLIHYAFHENQAIFQQVPYKNQPMFYQLLYSFSIPRLSIFVSSYFQITKSSIYYCFLMTVHFINFLIITKFINCFLAC